MIQTTSEIFLLKQSIPNRPYNFHVTTHITLDEEHTDDTHCRSVGLNKAYCYSLPVSWCLTFEFVISTDTPGSDNGTSLNISMIHNKI